MLDPAGSPFPVPALEEEVAKATVDTVADFNDVVMQSFSERDVKVLAEQVRADIDKALSDSDGQDPEKAIPWLGGSEVPLGGVLAHLLNELQIHGRDIADATKSPWAVEPTDAALFFELFVLGVTSYGYGRLLEDKVPSGKPPRQGRIAVEFRSKHTSPVAMVLHNGRVSVEEAGRDIDVHLFFDPVTLNLMLFGRISRMRAGLTGKVVVWGRRPWLLPTFLRTVRLPS